MRILYGNVVRHIKYIIEQYHLVVHGEVIHKKPANYSLLYHANSHTHFRFPGLNRLVSQEQGGTGCVLRYGRHDCM